MSLNACKQGSDAYRLLPRCKSNDQNHGLSMIFMKSLLFHLCFVDELNVLETIFLRFNLLVNRGLIVS